MNRSPSRSLLGLLGLVVGLSAAACGDDDIMGTGGNNQAPNAVVSANPTQVPPRDANATIVTIDASNSTDPDGDALTFGWTVPSGTFENGTTASDATIDVSFPGTAPYIVTVVVSDGNGGSDSADITIGLSSGS